MMSPTQIYRKLINISKTKKGVYLIELEKANEESLIISTFSDKKHQRFQIEPQDDNTIIVKNLVDQKKKTINEKEFFDEFPDII